MGERSPPQIVVRPPSPQINAQWTATFYENVQLRALDLQETKVEKLHRHKMHEKKVEKKEPADALGKEWLSEEPVTLETRAYLLDKLLPTLVPGVETLLRVAERKRALEDFQPHTFNPINFLGEYLMRNNPAYEVSQMPNPYVRGMKLVTDELKTQVPETTMHKLAQMKSLVKEKRKQREEVAHLRGEVTTLRKQALGVQFTEWTADACGQIPLALVQSALKSFLEVVTSAAADAGTGIYARPLEALGTLEVKVNEEEFAEYVLSYIKTFTSDMFQELLQHLLQCANDARNAIRHDTCRRMFVQLFLDCDFGKVGLLDRHRILTLLETFYDNSPLLVREGLWDPRKWPVAELDDINLTVFWGDMEDDELSKASSIQTLTELGLSEEALAINLILRDILSGMEVAGKSSSRQDLPAAAQEGAGLEQRASSAEQGSEAVLATASADRGPEVQAEQDPATEETAPATEDVAVSPSEVAPPDAIQEEPLAPVLGADGVAEPESPAVGSPSATAASPRRSLEGKESRPSMQSGPEEGEVGAEAGAAEPAAGPGDETAAPDQEAGPEGPAAQEKTEADGQESTEDQPPAQVEPQDQATDLLSSPAQKASETSVGVPQLIYGKPWSGDLETADLTFKYSDYGKEVREDWNHENSRFPDLRMNMIEIQTRGPPSCTSAFDKAYFNLPQFVQLMETFVGEEACLPVLKKLVEFVKENYVQTQKEKVSQLETVRRHSLLVRQQLLLAALFEKWDNECSGFLDMQEVDAVLSTFKEGMEEDALNKAKLQLPIPSWHPSGVVKLSQKEFQAYIELVVSELTGNEDELLDNVVEFLMTAVERTHIERLRGSARRKWLHGLEHVAKSCGGCLEPVYQAVFKTLCRDADAHGDGKRISAYIALLEYNLLSPERGDILLRYVACTEDDVPYVLDQILYMDMNGVSFAAVLDDKPIHVPRVQLHGNIHFWNLSRPECERKGSFLVLPLEDIRRRVFGILGMDTLRDHNRKTIFVPHEIRFYQGVSNAFSIAYHHIRTQDSVMEVIRTGVEWLSDRTPDLQAVTAYFMEPGENRMLDYTLRKVLTSDLKGQVEIHLPPGPVLSRRENIFRDYLFKCIDCAGVVTACVYEEHRIAVPLRNPTGQAIAALDLNLGHYPKLPSCEHKDLQKMLKMMQAATCEILKEDSGDLDPYYVLEAEYVGDWRRGGVLFYRFMLQDLQNCIWNLDPWLSFGEIKSSKEPLVLVHKILKCVLLILYPQCAGTEDVEDWNYCVQKLERDLIENVCYFDPTAAHVHAPPEILRSCLQGVSRKNVWRCGSPPLEYLYNWALTCLSLTELAKKLQHGQNVPAATPALRLSLPQRTRSLDSAANTNRSSSFLNKQ